MSAWKFPRAAHSTQGLWGNMQAVSDPSLQQDSGYSGGIPQSSLEHTATEGEYVHTWFLIIAASRTMDTDVGIPGNSPEHSGSKGEYAEHGFMLPAGPNGRLEWEFSGTVQMAQSIHGHTDVEAQGTQLMPIWELPGVHSYLLLVYHPPPDSAKSIDVPSESHPMSPQGTPGTMP